ncbi:hypothetical protein BASA83_011695 [Batrachochytrium salamandrivorans]|nr:hypothetical protein BASA83_011695 [Batrachochytrium salamandrivorans]
MIESDTTTSSSTSTDGTTGTTGTTTVPLPPSFSSVFVHCPVHLLSHADRTQFVLALQTTRLDKHVLHSLDAVIVAAGWDQKNLIHHHPGAVTRHCIVCIPSDRAETVVAYLTHAALAISDPHRTDQPHSCIHHVWVYSFKVLFCLQMPFMVLNTVDHDKHLLAWL